MDVRANRTTKSFQNYFDGKWKVSCLVSHGKGLNSEQAGVNVLVY